MVAARGARACVLSLTMTLFAACASAQPRDAAGQTEPQPATDEGASWREQARAAVARGEVEMLDTALSQRSALAQDSGQTGQMLYVAKLRAMAQTVDAPVMTPRALMARGGEFVALPKSYSQRTEWSDRAVVNISGSCAIAKSRASERASADYRKRGRRMARLSRLNVEYEATETDYGLVFTFSKFGCSYSVTASCLPSAGETGACVDGATLATMSDDMLIANAPK